MTCMNKGILTAACRLEVFTWVESRLCEVELEGFVLKGSLETFKYCSWCGLLLKRFLKGMELR